MGGRGAAARGLSRPPRQHHQRVTGSDQESWLRAHVADSLSAIKRAGDRDGALGLTNQRQGFDRKPDVVDHAALDEAVRSGWIEVWRGVDPGMSVASTAKSAREINDEFKSGDFFPGLGLYGNGTYTSVSKDVALVYAGHVPEFGESMEPGGLVRLAIDPDSRIVNYDQVLREQKQFLGTVPADSPLAVLAGDAGRFAAMRGYDIVKVVGQTDGSDILNPATGRDDHDQYVILNRTAVKVQREEP
jgi:hypothetical protein